MSPAVLSRVAALCESERFTRAEQRIAMDLFRGRDLREMELQRGVRITTLRTQLQAVFGKTGTRRQGELIAWLAHEIIMDLLSLIREEATDAAA